ncbi:MAG TPA: UDP-N-acetylmuramyl-tripeptide synthetase, partial [Candidatus Paceibacterota bacterium]|nr:UDP-N-acetylmuramyl-tripeptide synthetase [Candidatus Paceibacterota bacterium]
MESLLQAIKRLIPRRLFKALQPLYHYALALCGAILYGFPSKKLVVIGVTGSKGKTTTVEMVNAVLEAAGFSTALASTLRFKTGALSRGNTYKMSMPGRFFQQRFLAEALRAGCTHAVMEMSSEGVPQFRHRFLYPDALVFTNIEPEHIESHGSFEKYVAAKLEIGKRVVRNGKARQILVANGDDAETAGFQRLGITEEFLYSLKDAKPYETDSAGASFTFSGTPIRLKLPGVFNIYNALAAATLGKALGIPLATLKRGLESIERIPGRAERVDAGQPFDVIVDYAHTPKSLESIYRAYEGKERICVLSGTGGGRDKWKRPLMGGIASEHCSRIVLTDEDPYDEDPGEIVSDIKTGITLPREKVEVVMDRRKAIERALVLAKEAERPGAVLITGKGTDPYIMGPRGSKTPWSDARVAREELEKLG